MWLHVCIGDQEVAHTRYKRMPVAPREMFVKINGERHYLWRAVDREGEVLESFVTKKRDKKAALKFLKKRVNIVGLRS